MYLKTMGGASAAPITIDYTSAATAAGVTVQHILATATKNGSVTLAMKASYSAQINVDNANTTFGTSKLIIGQNEYILKDYVTDIRGWCTENNFTFSALSVNASDVISVSLVVPSASLSSNTVTWKIDGVVS